MKTKSYFRKWLAYQKGIRLAIAIQELSDAWPRQERYKLVDQILRSSRSVCSNLGEAYGKRDYPKHFTSKLTDAISENYETQVWLDFALAYKYIEREKYEELIQNCDEVGRLLSHMHRNIDNFRRYPPDK